MNAIKKILSAWVYPIGLAVIIAILINKFIFFEISVPTPSMFPTIKPNDKIITTRIYNINSIKRGDILVFKSDELQETLVKRVIGLPNDSVEIKKDGSVFINGEKLNEPYVKYPSNKTGTFKVPEREYLFLGDYRVHSYDSRLWKNPFISEKDIKGRATYIIFPFNRVSKLK